MKNRSAFIRTVPMSTPIPSVIALAKVKGMKVSPSLVHKVRSDMRDKMRKTAKPASVPAVMPSTPRAHSAKHVLVVIASEIGMSKAIDILMRLRAAALLIIKA